MSEESFLPDILSIINDKQQVTYTELSDIAFSRNIPRDVLDTTLANLEKGKMIASRSSGGILTYYTLQQDTINKVLIVEDDRSINKLMALSIGKGFEIMQIYDGGEAMEAVRRYKPQLVILDLMLPHKDGLDICQTIKEDPEISGTIVILVSAMDPTSNRFKGIKYGADYYIKKPFDPNELKSLVTIFLKKKGKRFDPLIDLPNEERISNAVSKSIESGEDYSIGALRIANLGSYAKRFGEKSAVVIIRLVSQLIQDAIRNKESNVFAGFMNTEDFIIAGVRKEVASTVESVKQEFNAVMPFILQDEGYKSIDLDIDSLFDSNEVPKLSLIYSEIEKSEIKKRVNELNKEKLTANGEIGAYTYEELQKLFGREDFDIKITRDGDSIKLHVGKVGEE
ncbi:MAG: response regulator transcription factor [Candidatus Micrarchaeaceae archaeon]